MSLDLTDLRDGDPVSAHDLLVRAGRAEVLARQLREASVRDLMMPDAARLDDQRRLALRTLIRAVVENLSAAIGDRTRHLLSERDKNGALQALSLVDTSRILPMVESCLTCHAAVAGDLIDRVTLDLIGENLPSGVFAAKAAPWPAGLRTLDKRLATVRRAESRRRVSPGEASGPLDLSAESLSQFGWWVAASFARTADSNGDDRIALEQALADATGQVLATHDDREQLERAALSVAETLDLYGDALAAVVEHCLAERRIVLLTAFLAHGLGISMSATRSMIVDPGNLRLWLSLRALDLPPETVARLGYAICDADRRRNVTSFAEGLHRILAIPREAADAALSPLRLPDAFHAAMSALA
jgi:hypothetical protein